MTLDQSWRPNWRDLNTGVYPDHEDLRSWGWEFLRRNPEYQRDYAQWSALPDTENADDGVSVLSAKYRDAICMADAMSFYPCSADSPSLEGESVEQYEKRTGHVVERTLRQSLENKWCVSRLVDPADECAPSFCGDVDVPPFGVDWMPSEFIQARSVYAENIVERALCASWPKEIDEDVVAYGFDLSIAIDPQIEIVRAVLREMQKERDIKPVTHPGSHKGTYETLLRILDARDSGASDKEIEDSLCLCKTKKASSEAERADEAMRLADRASEWLSDNEKRAIELRDSTYANLLAFSELPISREAERKRKSREKQSNKEAA